MISGEIIKETYVCLVKMKIQILTMLQNTNNERKYM